MIFNWSILTAFILRQRSGWKIIIKNIHIYKSLDQWINHLSLSLTMSIVCFLYKAQKFKTNSNYHYNHWTNSVMFPFNPILSHFRLCHATFNMALCCVVINRYLHITEPSLKSMLISSSWKARKTARRNAKMSAANFNTPAQIDRCRPHT